MVNIPINCVRNIVCKLKKTKCLDGVHFLGFYMKDKFNTEIINICKHVFKRNVLTHPNKSKNIL
jgi:hypothetical protein